MLLPYCIFLCFALLFGFCVLDLSLHYFDYAVAHCAGLSALGLFEGSLHIIAAPQVKTLHSKAFHNLVRLEGYIFTRVVLDQEQIISSSTLERITLVSELLCFSVNSNLIPSPLSCGGNR